MLNIQTFISFLSSSIFIPYFFLILYLTHTSFSLIPFNHSCPCIYFIYFILLFLIFIIFPFCFLLSCFVFYFVCFKYYLHHHHYTLLCHKQTNNKHKIYVFCLIFFPAVVFLSLTI